MILNKVLCLQYPINNYYSNKTAINKNTKIKIMFEKMTKEEALSYCYENENKFKADAYKSNENGQRQFDCLIEIIESGTIEPKELPSKWVHNAP